MGASVYIEDILEIFFIHSVSINFVGAMIEIENEKAYAAGKIIFQNGHTIAFSHPMDDRKMVRKRLKDMGQGIANLYGAELLHRHNRESGFYTSLDTLNLGSKILH